MTPDDEVLGRAYDHRLMRRLLGYLRPYRAQVALAALLVLVESLAVLAGPYLTKEAIDRGIRHRDLGHLDRVAVLYFATLLAAFAFSFLHTRLIQRVGQRVMLDLRLALFRQIQRLPISYFDRVPIGRLMTRVTNDVDALNELATAGVLAVFGDLFMVVGIVFAMVRLNAELLLVAFSVLPLIVIVSLTFRLKVRRSFRDIRTRLARMNAFLNENLTGMSTVQLLNREARNAREFREVNAGHRDANLQAVFYHAMFFPVLELVGALAVSLIVWYGGRQVMWTGITLGTLVAFIQYTQRFFRPIADLSEKYNILQQAMASSERIFELLDTDPEPAPALEEEPAESAVSAGPGANGRGTPHAAAPGSIAFENVWYAYHGEDWVVRDVSFTIAPGERVALVGATGSGKSTLASLLLRFYEPGRGVIRVDGRPLAEWSRHALRARIGLVLQEPFLFSGTIEENLRFGAPALPREMLERAAREVGAHEFIQRLPGGYAAEVRERGATLSSGQRQLISFARALVRSPDLLVLDEATSSVDTHTERQVQAGLRRLMEGRTSLVIAHRLSTILDADRIVVIHRGSIREVGSHTQLLALGGIYARLYQLQILGGREGSSPRRASGLESNGGQGYDAAAAASAVDSPPNLA